MRVALSIVVALALGAQDVRDTDPKQRARAAKEAIKAGSEGIAQIAPLLDDPDTSVRVETVKSIVEIGSQHSLNPLVKALADQDHEIQIRATDGLVNFYFPGYFEESLSESLSRSGDVVKARFSSETNSDLIDFWIRVRPQIVTALGNILRGSTSWDARANAARALGVLRGREALGELHAALRLKNTRLMYESLIALQKIADPRSGQSVIFLFRDPEEHVAVAALTVAGIVRSSQALADIELTLNRAASARVRLAALRAMARIGDTRSRSFFVAALEDNDEYVRAAATEGIARLRNPADLPTLDRCASSEERKTPPRLACAFGVILHGKVDATDEGSLRYLIDALNSRAWQSTAERYLVELAQIKNVRVALHNSLSSPTTKDEKIFLTQVLAASGDADSVGVLERLMRDPDSDVMIAGVRALRNLKARLP